MEIKREVEIFWDWPEETIRDTSGVYMMSGVNRN
jgi:hypothetical protein